MNLVIFQPLQVGRADLQRKAFAQGRQAFRRALAAVPEKLLLKQRQVGFVSWEQLKLWCFRCWQVMVEVY